MAHLEHHGESQTGLIQTKNSGQPYLVELVAVMHSDCASAIKHTKS
jgi:hypothetical protein